jgi:4-aminobutyrate aminotransferase-like enzyme
VLTTDRYARALPWAAPSGATASAGGNPLGAAGGTGALRVLDEERLVDNAREVGGSMLRELAPFVDDYPFVGEVRGRGLLLAIELVRSKRSKEPLPTHVTRRVYDACVARGLLAMTYAPRVRLQPALTLDAATARNGIAILREVFDLAKREHWWDRA